MLYKQGAEEPSEYKTIPALGFKTVGDTGVVEHLISVFGVVDLGMDITQPGAFVDSLKDRAGRIRVLDQHHKERVGDAIGVPLELKEVERDGLPEDVREAYPEATGGLWAKTQFLMDTPEGRGAFTRLKNKAVSEFSFAYNPVQVSFTDQKDGTEVRNLEKVDIFEYSPVLFAMNPAARSIAAKDAEGNDQVTVPPDPIVHLLEKADLSITKTVKNLRDRFDETFNPDNAEGYKTWRYWVKEIFDTYMIVEDNDENGYFKVTYTYTGEAEDAKFASQETWVPGTYVFVEKQSEPPTSEDVVVGQMALAMLEIEIAQNELLLAQ